MITPTRIFTGSTSFPNKFVSGFAEVLNFVASFDAGEQGAITFQFPYPVRITKLDAIVTKALAITDAGTITVRNNLNVVMGTLTFAAASVIGTRLSVVPIANNIIKQNEDITVAPAKTTAGGKVMLTIHYERSLDS